MEYTFENAEEKLLRQFGGIILTDMKSGRYCYAKLNYMSCHGMYFETECAIKSGNIIDLHFDVPPLKGAQKRYRATVHWCMPLSEDDPNRKYGIGVKYL